METINLPEERQTRGSIPRKDLTALILAAGESRRMGRSKALIPYGGSNFLLNIVNKTASVCGKIVIVTGFESSVIENLFSSAQLPSLRLITNENYKKGMFTSLKKGLEDTNTDYIMYHFVDNPLLPEYFYNEFVNQLRSGYNWFQPVFGGRKGHPIIFDRFTAGLITAAPDWSSLKEISKSGALKKNYWNCRCPEIFTDIDTPEDLKGLK